MPTLIVYEEIQTGSGIEQWPLVTYTYSVSSTNTTTTLTGTAPKVDTSGVSVRVTVGGTEIWNQVDHTKYTTTNKKTVNRTKSAQSQEVKLIVVDSIGTYTKVGTFDIPALDKYTITYSANSHGTAPAAKTKYYGDTITLSAAISATGYAFKRWNTNNVDTGTAYNASASYSANANVTLYAIWNRTVTYNGNGGTSVPAAQTAIATSAITITSSKPTYTRFTFKNWNTKADGTGTNYTGGNSYAANNPNVTLYAIWNHTVSYNANGGTGAPAAQTALKTSAITLSTTKPTYSGYTFKNWNTKANGTGTAYTSGGSYAANAVGTTLYAIWDHTITYNANGGTGAPTSQTALKTSAITITSSTPNYSGYTFKDWNTKADGTGTTYTSGGSYPANTVGTTLYAQWGRTITYDANGGSNAPATQTGIKNTPITITSSQPVYTGYIFKDWCTAADGIGASYSSGGTYPADNPSIILYARWNHKIEYNANGGTNAPADSVALKANPITVTSNAPTYTGYTFKNWNTASDGTGTSYISDSSYPADTVNTILYAIWNRTITYDINGGNDDSLIPTPQTDEITNPITITSSTPSKTDYAFVEWNTEADGTGISYPSGAIYAANLPNVILYAQWESDPGGGGGSEIEPEKIIDFTMVDTEGNPINEGGPDVPPCAIELIIVPCNPVLECVGKLKKQDFTYTSNFLYQKGDSYTLVNSSNIDFENNTYYEKIPYDFDYYDWQIMSSSTV